MAEHKRVLIVEDDAMLRRTLERLLVRENCDVVEASDGQEGVDKIDSFMALDLIITDMNMPRGGGEVVVAAGARRQIPVVVVTGNTTNVEMAVRMMRGGAANYILKPFDQDSIRRLLDDAFGKRRSVPSGPVHRVPKGQVQMTGEDPRFREVIETLQAVADTDATVLILGETGTGKEVAARLIHSLSNRSRGPFVAVNCGAIPESLIEAELFGVKKGAYTDATQSRAGRFQQAEGGTIFLDEIGDTPLSFQVKLLRVLQERTVEAVGDPVSRSIDVRVVAATHRDLKALVEENKFRLDLYYRLNVVDVRLPPLRDRRGDIKLLLDQFLHTANDRYGRKVTGISAAVLTKFEGYAWPGNIRELANVVERMVVLKKDGGELTLSDLPPQLHMGGRPGPAGGAAGLPAALPPEGIDLRAAIATFEDSLIGQALERTHGNRNAAAMLLGLNRTTLVEKLRRKREASLGGAVPPDPDDGEGTGGF